MVMTRDRVVEGRVWAVSDGGVFKRCGCRDWQTGRSLDTVCPRLGERNHGSWYFDCAVTAVPGRRGRVRRGGYATRRDAVTARDTLLNHAEGEATTVEAWTVARWLRYWLTTRTSLRPSTLRSYTEHVERHLIPHLGRIPLGELTTRHITDMIGALSATTSRYGRALTPSTLRRIRATLRPALNAAVRGGLLRDNPARHVEVPSPRRPQAQVWTDHRVAHWRQTGRRFAVAVWTTQQLAAFLDFVKLDRLYAMWWLVAMRGLRRGEAAGLRWIDVDLDAKVIMIGQQRIAYGHTVTVGPPKTAASRRTIALDRHTVRLLRAHRKQQQAERTAAGELWQDSGYVFTTPDGTPLHPDWLTRRFGRLVKDSGLPPVRLHDLRHGAASLAHAAGGDLKTVQEQLGHTSIVLTAEATVRLVLAAAAINPGHRHRRRPPTSAAARPTHRPEPLHRKGSDRKRRRGKGRPHAPHARPTKIKAV